MTATPSPDSQSSSSVSPGVGAPSQDLADGPKPFENDDGRKRGEWETRYPREVWHSILIEGAYLVTIFLLCIVCLFYTWIDGFSSLLSIHEAKTLSLNRYLFYLFGGILGGVLFGMKWLYHSVARGFWNVDRKPWRYLVPILSGGFAFASSFVIEAGLSRIPASGREAEYVAVGFLIGYFSDKAIAKLSEVADIVFGAPGKRNP